MEFVVDMQGFQNCDGSFLVKEIAILCIKDMHYVTHIFNAPFPWNNLDVKFKAINSWLIRNFHGIKWEDGHLPHQVAKCVISDALREATIIFVKGKEKKNFLEQCLDTSKFIVDLSCTECPSLKKLSTKPTIKCNFHNSKHDKMNCSLTNVQLLKVWLDDNSFDL